MAGLPGILFVSRGKYMFKTKVNIKALDYEWIQLILEAKKLGIEKEKIREFLKREGLKKLVLENH